MCVRVIAIYLIIGVLVFLYIILNQGWSQDLVISMPMVVYPLNFFEENMLRYLPSTHADVKYFHGKSVIISA